MLKSAFVAKATRCNDYQRSLGAGANIEKVWHQTTVWLRLPKFKGKASKPFVGVLGGVVSALLHQTKI